MTAIIQQEQSWGQIVSKGLGWVALAIGIVALFVPLIPATPFFLVAALAFAV
jgi:uncharacterized membrane protein YbaN (DUF454 family)